MERLHTRSQVNEAARPHSTAHSVLRQTVLVVGALIELLRFDAHRKFRNLCETVSTLPNEGAHYEPDNVAAVLTAISRAELLYPKKVLCLQHAVTTVRMLRQRRIPARVVMGYRPAPLYFHAWVELDGQTLTGHLSGLEFFQILERL
jgi:hypothetical protein